MNTAHLYLLGDEFFTDNRWLRIQQRCAQHTTHNKQESTSVNMQ